MSVCRDGYSLESGLMKLTSKSLQQSNAAWDIEVQKLGDSEAIFWMGIQKTSGV